jgi:hypothetical protein
LTYFSVVGNKESARRRCQRLAQVSMGKQHVQPAAGGVSGRTLLGGPSPPGRWLFGRARVLLAAASPVEWELRRRRPRLPCLAARRCRQPRHCPAATHAAAHRQNEEWTGHTMLHSRCTTFVTHAGALDGGAPPGRADARCGVGAAGIVARTAPCALHLHTCSCWNVGLKLVVAVSCGLAVRHNAKLA